MPCKYDGPDEQPIMRGELDITTRLACEYCNELQDSGRNIPSYARKWWKKHQAEDADRVKQEMEEEAKKILKAKALKKLTAEEKKALGLKFYPL